MQAGNLPDEVQKAIDQAESWQAESWLNLTTEISGVEVEQMTLNHFFLLDGIDSPFIKNRSFTPGDLGVFLWILSPDYQPGRQARDEFIKSIVDVNIAEAVNDISDYLTATFQDAETAGDESKKYANFIAYMVDMFAREYSWHPDQILNLPMRQIYQLATAIGERYAKQAGETYTKLRVIDMMEAQAMLDQARAAKAKNN